MIAAKSDSTTTRATGLPQLAKRINEEHAAAETAMRDGLSHAVEAGKLLVEAKKQCEHGKWLPWIKESCEFSARTAQGYMRVASKLLEDGNAQRVAHMSYRQALNELEEMQRAIAADERCARRETLSSILGRLKNLQPPGRVRDVLDGISQLPKPVPKWVEVLQAGQFSPEARRFAVRKLNGAIRVLERFRDQLRNVTDDDG